GRLRAGLEAHGSAVYRVLCDNGALVTCRFGTPGRPDSLGGIESVENLRAWASGAACEAVRTLAPDRPELRGEELVGEILLTFERLTPLFACALADDPGPLRAWLGPGSPPEAPTGFDADDFQRATHLGDGWLRRVRSLLEMKRQLI